MSARVEARPSVFRSPLFATAIVFGLLYAAGAAAYPRFGSLRVLVALVGDNGFLGVSAVGATFVIVSGGVDLSAGAVVAASSVGTARLVAEGWSPAAAMTTVVLLGAAFGAFLGAFIVRFRLPPFLVTLAGMFLARGVAFMISPRSLAIRDPFFTVTAPEALALPLGGGATWPWSASVFVLVALCGGFVLRRTAFGRRVYAIGDDETAATYLGVPVGPTRIGVYAVAGACSAFAGVVYAVYTQSGDPAACQGLELDAIAAVVIGGATLSGGAGGVAGSVLGVLTLGLVQTHVAFHGGLNAWWTRIFVGGLLLAFVAAGRLVESIGRRRA